MFAKVTWSPDTHSQQYSHTFRSQSECCTLFVYFVSLDGEIVPFIFIMKLSRLFFPFFPISFRTKCFRFSFDYFVHSTRRFSFHFIFTMCIHCKSFWSFSELPSEQPKSTICTVHIFKRNTQTHTHRKETKKKCRNKNSVCAEQREACFKVRTRTNCLSLFAVVRRLQMCERRMFYLLITGNG